MQDKGVDKQHFNTADDIFDDYFRDNLEEHQMPVDEKSWENISQRIRPVKKRFIWMALYSGVAAAVVFLILFFGAQTNSSKGTLASENQVVSNENNIENQILLSIIKSNQRIDALTYCSGIKKILSEDNFKNVVQDCASANDTALEVTNVYDCATSEAVKEEKAMTVSKMSKDTSGRKKSYDDSQLLAYEPMKHDEWEISATITSCGINSESRENNHFRNNLESGLYDSNMEPLLCSSPARIVVEQYAPPVSVGLLAKKRLNKTLSVETGLTYSYLSTSFKDIDNISYSATLRLHYIGIPVNLVAEVWDLTPKCKIYASAGMMVEKGVKTDFSQYISETQQSISNEKRIKGLQWSLNGSVGISYNIHKNWAFYLEPRASHYFDNNQPLSIRTKKQTIIGINSGFRYDF